MLNLETFGYYYLKFQLSSAFPEFLPLLEVAIYLDLFSPFPFLYLCLFPDLFPYYVCACACVYVFSCLSSSFSI